MLIKVAEILKSIVPEDSVLVRNSGLRLMIISKNTNVDTMNQVIERVLSRVTTEVEYYNNEEIKTIPVYFCPAASCDCDSVSRNLLCHGTFPADRERLVLCHRQRGVPRYCR